MAYQMTVSPDFTPDHISGWYIFNTWLQKTLGMRIHLELYDSFASQRNAIIADEVDLIYVNPYDASMLVREKGFYPVVRPVSTADEAIIAVNQDYPARQVEDLTAGISIAATEDPDVNLMCAIMLEPAELNAHNTQLVTVSSYPLVAKALIHHQTDLGFFLAEAFNSLSRLTRRQIRPLVVSQINVMHHALLVSPRLAKVRNVLRKVLVGMAHNPRGAGVLAAMGFNAWEIMDHEEMEFMIDLVDTLTYQPA
jgi:phosphonate transport system substrate-binding protein